MHGLLLHTIFSLEQVVIKRVCCGMNIPFSKYYGIKGLVMDKRRAIQIMTKAAEIYRDNLEDQKVLFLYGLPSDVKKQLQIEGKILSSIQG